MMTTNQGGLEVREAGRALKVQSEVPHLVSLGGGRLSTAVTLHPLHEGRLSIGSSPSVDILVQGTGVEGVHAHIENADGVVTLFPLAEMTSVDGVRVMSPTRLTQGSMVCIGRSNYMRFNHPAEARVMRNALPNARISMVPLNFYNGNVDNVDGMDRKPPMAPRRSPRDSWADSISNSSSCNSNEEQHLSPKVFPMGSVTVNSPASAVLGPGRVVKSPATANGDAPKTYQNVPPPSPNGVIARNGPNNGSAFSQTSNTFNSYMRSATPTNGASNNNSSNNFTNGNLTQNQPSQVATQTFTNKAFRLHNESRSVTASPAFDDHRSLAERRLGSVTSLPGINMSSMPSPTSGRDASAGEYRVLTTPSPAFNRNPSPGFRGFSARSVTPSPPKPANGVQHRRTLSASSQDNLEHIRRVSSPSPSYGSNHSLEELVARKEEAESQRKKAQTERLREQETERNERARLEEILSMCADYERQVQLEKQCKSPAIPQNRIKTNGSLPRDKRLPSPTVAEDEIAEVFTFDQSAAPPSVPATQSPLPPSQGARSSPSPGPGAGVGRSPYENVVLSAGGVAYPQSPRTRIRTIANKDAAATRDTTDGFENRLVVSGDYEFVTSLPRRLGSKSPAPAVPPKPSGNRSRPSTPQPPGPPSGQATPLGTPKHAALTATPNRMAADREKLILPLDISPVDRQPMDLSPVDRQPVNPSPADRQSLDMNPVDRLSEALEAMKVQNALRNSERRRSIELRNEKEKLERAKNEMCVEDERQQQNIMRLKAEYDALRKDRCKLLAAMSGLKRNITDIEQQEEEMLRELEMERALLSAEWVAQSEKRSVEATRQVELRRQLAALDQDVEHFSAREIQRQADCTTRLEAAADQLMQSEIELSECGDDPENQKRCNERVRIHREHLEQERKTFEDLEFRHLEEEADCLAGHDELQRELCEVTQRLEARTLRLAELDTQRMEANHSAELESQGLERDLISNLRKLEEVRNRLRMIESNMEDLSNRGLFNHQDSSPDASSDNDEGVRPSSAQSPEDMARISRVTQGAPLELGTGSLGRRTLESLQTIERNRQLHLVQQGSQVIENERKRVEELKRRVQDEVRAQWAEEQRQRENNCYSLNSVGSDEASSDVPESASSDDTADKRNSAQNAADNKHEIDVGVQQRNSMREKELELQRNREETRPLTDGSDYEQQLSVNMRDREKAARLQHQRPLTRYLPIRSERLDLRHHIETAGHQVELCPHVALDKTSCRGYLHKLGAKFHHWGKRWFVLDRNLRTLTYYADRTEKKARGGTYFQVQITAVDIDPSILEVAEKYFGLVQDSRLNVVIEDGVEFLTQAAVQEGKGNSYEAILFDIDSKDQSVGMSCPPAQFLQPSLLTAVKHLLKPKGVFVLNLVCRKTELRSGVVAVLGTVFPHIYAYQLDEDVNEVMFCSEAVIDSDTIVTAANLVNNLPIKNKPVDETSENFIDVTSFMASLKIEKSK